MYLVWLVEVNVLITVRGRFLLRTPCTRLYTQQCGDIPRMRNALRGTTSIFVDCYSQNRAA